MTKEDLEKRLTVIEDIRFKDDWIPLLEDLINRDYDTNEKNLIEDFDLLLWLKNKDGEEITQREKEVREYASTIISEHLVIMKEDKIMKIKKYRMGHRHIKKEVQKR